MLGSSIFIIGMGWTIAEVGGPKAYGMVFTAYFLGHLPLLFYGGMVVDRMPRRTVALISDLSQAVLVALAMFALMAGFDVINTLLVITFLTGGAGAFSIPAIGALVPDLVEEEILPQANALRGVAMTAAWMLGPLIGGFTVEQWGIELCLFLDVLTFLFSGAVLWTIAEIPIEREDGVESEGRSSRGMGFRENPTMVISWDCNVHDLAHRRLGDRNRNSIHNRE